MPQPRHSKFIKIRVILISIMTLFVLGCGSSGTKKPKFQVIEEGNAESEEAIRESAKVLQKFTEAEAKIITQQGPLAGGTNMDQLIEIISKDPTTELKQFKIKGNLNLYSIAEKYTGNWSNWAYLFLLNQGNFQPSESLDGKTVVITVKRRLRTKQLRWPASKDYCFSIRKTVLSKKKHDLIKYTIKKDDTLQKISQQHYGTTRRWIEIYSLNCEKLKSNDLIRVGTTIKLMSPAEYSK
jgi:nucleoid-associated protein YgaU